MNNLSEDIINKYLTGQCSEEELIEVNAWMKESEENARQLFRMEEIYHLGKFDQYADGQRMLRAEKRLYKKLDEEKGKQNKILRMRRWMKYAAVIAIIFAISGGIGYWFYHNGTDQQMMVAVANEGIVKEVVLPDGTKVWLNNSATLKYPREFSEKNVMYIWKEKLTSKLPKIVISHSPYKVTPCVYAYWVQHSTSNATSVAG